MTSLPRDLDLRGAALALLLSAFWGANPAALKIGLTDAPPIRLAWIRIALGGLSILGWALGTKALSGIRIERREWRPLAILGALLVVQIGLMNFGTNLTTASHSSVLLNAYAVHTVVLAHFQVPGDRLTLRKLLGSLIAYVGIVLLFAPRLGGSGATLTGDLIVAASGVLLGERTVYLASTVQRIDPVKLLLAQALVGSVLLLGVSLWVEGGVPYRWTTPLILSVLYQGVVVAGFNFTANLWLLQHYRPSSLAGLFLTTPIFGVLVSAAMLGEPLTWALLLAALLVAAGIGLTSRPT